MMLPHSHQSETGNHHGSDNGSPSKDDMISPFLTLDDGPSSSGLLQAKQSLSMLFERPVHTIHVHWRKFDDAYMRPIFGGPGLRIEEG